VFHDPTAPARIRDELARALADRGFASLQEAIGHAHRGEDLEPAHAGAAEDLLGDPVDLDAVFDAGAEG
jgi:hypothetical protein